MSKGKSIAEKVSALQTETSIAESAARADIPKALAILKRAGVGRAPMKGDEMPAPERRRRVLKRRDPSLRSG